MGRRTLVLIIAVALAAISGFAIWQYLTNVEDDIRALYGHSIPVEPGEPSRPPELLFLAIPARDVDRAQRFGLRGGRRRFVHLALSEDDARETHPPLARAAAFSRNHSQVRASPSSNETTGS